jgi:hypothetical protein
VKLAEPLPKEGQPKATTVSGTSAVDENELRIKRRLAHGVPAFPPYVRMGRSAFPGRCRNVENHNLRGDEFRILVAASPPPKTTSF